MKVKIGSFLGPLIVTVLALAVAIMILAGRWRRNTPGQTEQPERVIPPTPVSVTEVQLQSIEITDGYSGMIRPRERFVLGFEIAGRVERLGINTTGEKKGEFLDEGDWVSADDVLAQLDDRVLRARLEEVKAQLDQAKARVREYNARLEKAQSDMARARELRQRGSGVITNAEYQDVAAQLAVAEAQTTSAKAQQVTALAQIQMATKNLEDSTLRSPVRGVISKRYVNAGESVNPQQPIMEIIQVDDVLLVVGVPEAYVGGIRAGQPVHVELLARDRFRRKRPRTEGKVYQVAEAADQTTGLFDVEILLPNPRGDWKPGLIALAKIVVDEVRGLRIPMSCAVFRDEETFVFLLDEVGRDGKAYRFGLQDWIEEGSDLIVPVTSEAFRSGRKFLFSRGDDGKARQFDVRGWLAQGSNGIVPDPPDVYWTVVSRGQHRLVDGRKVKRVQLDDDRPAKMDSRPMVRPAAAVVGSKP
jgi:RND family efflux transporter MFP subunit